MARFIHYLVILLFPLFLGCQGSSSKSSGAKSDSLVAMDHFLAKAPDSFHFVPDSATLEELPEPDPTIGSSTGVITKNVQPEELVRFAESLVGIPYVYGSTDPKLGFDCSGFITYVFNNFGIKVPRSSVEFTDVGIEIPMAEARRGDIILFTGTNPLERTVGHMGIVVSNSDTLKFIHSTSGKAMGVTTTPLTPGYRKRFVKTLKVFN